MASRSWETLVRQHATVMLNQALPVTASCALSLGGMGIGATVSRTLGRPMFRTSPAEAAKEVWEASG